jgi:flagellar basal body-associated protein FliL
MIYIQNVGPGYAKKNLIGSDTLVIILIVVAVIILAALGFYFYKKRSTAKQIASNYDIINAHQPGANSFNE